MPIMIQLLGVAGLKLNSRMSARNNFSEVLQPEIVLQEFVDLDLELPGWYSFGHHDAKAFLAAVAKHRPGCNLRGNRVEHLWSTFDGRYFQLFNHPMPEARPVTIVKLFNQT